MVYPKEERVKYIGKLEEQVHAKKYNMVLGHEPIQEPLDTLKAVKISQTFRV